MDCSISSLTDSQSIDRQTDAHYVRDAVVNIPGNVLIKLPGVLML